MNTAENEKRVYMCVISTIDNGCSVIKWKNLKRKIEWSGNFINKHNQFDLIWSIEYILSDEKDKKNLFSRALSSAVTFVEWEWYLGQWFRNTLPVVTFAITTASSCELEALKSELKNVQTDCKFKFICNLYALTRKIVLKSFVHGNVFVAVQQCLLDNEEGI